MILNDRLIIHESSIILEELQQPHGVTSLEWWWMQGESARHMYIIYIFWNSNNVIYEQTLHFCCKKIHLYLSLMLSLSVFLEIALYVLEITLYVILEIVVVWFRKTYLRFLEITPASNRQRSWPSQQPGVSILRSMAGSSEKSSGWAHKKRCGQNWWRIDWKPSI